MSPLLRLTRMEDFSGTLTFAFAPGGELTFLGGIAKVDDDDPLDWLSRYPGLETYHEADTPDDTDADPAAWTESDAPFDPRALTVSELRDALTEQAPGDEERRALAALERQGDGRTTALGAIDAPDSDTEDST